MNCGISLVLSCNNCGQGNVVYAKFCIECGNSLATGVQPRPSPKDDSIKKIIPQEYVQKLEAARRTQTMQGERRIVTMLFCDVKGSTAMAEQLDPEEWAEIMNQAFEYLISPIYTYEGTLARLMGDSVLAFFGAPIAHEDDAQRAILAGLDIVKGIQNFKDKIYEKFKLEFDVRVGINTGLVVVGGVGSDLFMEYTAQGDAINIASRMEQTALPGTIQIGEDTYKQVAGLFEFEEVEGVEIKGKTEPLKVYRVLGLKEDPAHDRSLSGAEAQLVGRTVELDTLEDAISSVRKGRGQIVCLIGEAGLGKSRLVREARKIWESSLPDGVPLGQVATRWNQVSGVSYESSRPYGVVQRLIRNYIGVSSTDTTEHVRENLSETLSMIGIDVSEEWIDLFEIMLGVKEHSNGNQLAGEELKRKIYSEMLATLDLLAQAGPTVIAVDDLHWSDPASAEFIIHLLQLADRLPILFLCSFRAYHSSPAWMVKQAAERDYSHRYLEINLSPLSNSESNNLIDSLLVGSDLPNNIRRMILSKSDGNPFFTEEVIRGLIDEHILVQDIEGGEWHIDTAHDSISIPDNLQSLLSARIDRLEEEAKHVLQMASVIGRSFYHQVLEIINDEVDQLDSQLNNLQRLGLLLEKSREPELEYIFRQALTQETAYNTILLKNRREYHRGVADALVKLYPDRHEELSSVLGHHFYQARDQRALEFFKNEGEAAFRLYANLEAIDYFNKAIEVASWGQKIDLNDLEYLYICRGRAYELTSKFAEALDNYKELEATAVEEGDQAVELAALIAQAQIYSVPSSKFNIELGSSILKKAEKIAGELDDQETLAKLYWITMNLYRFQESMTIAQEFGEKAIALARELKLEEQLAYSLNDAAHAYSMNGKVGRALEVSLEAAELWEKLGNQPMLADSLAGLAALNVYTGEFDQAYRYSDQAYEISLSIDNIWGQSYSRYAIGLVDLERGHIDLALEHLHQTIRDAKISQFVAGEMLARTYLCVVYSELGMYEAAIQHVDNVFDPEVHNLTVTRAFFIGASFLAHARAGEIEESEKIMEEFRTSIEGVYFVARHFFVLAQCYLHLLKAEYQAALQLSEEFLSVLKDTGVVFLNPEILLIRGIA
jgi:class 3 adenylate cyclase/tetratricopeptide (TPR) repeat protein